VKDPLQYEGTHAVVTGCASGMGAATAAILTELGATVTGLDVQDRADGVARFLQVDLKDKASIDAAVAAIDGPVDSVFSVAGLPGPPFSDLDTVLVNFVGPRHLIESLVPKMPPGSAAVCVASNAGLGWQQEIESLLPVVGNGGFDEGKAWAEANPDAIASGYVPSKKLLNAWVAWRAVTLLDAGIRLNVTNPGPTDTAMMPAFEALAGKEMIDAFVGPSKRRSTAEEQAWPLVFLNSRRSSYIAGEALHTDAGFLGAATTGQIQPAL
jgi:NAD(P)-dependent dehydrogenase (short-subunit alcohol dehydrogenase family)